MSTPAKVAVIFPRSVVMVGLRAIAVSVAVMSCRSTTGNTEDQSAAVRPVGSAQGSVHWPSVDSSASVVSDDATSSEQTATNRVEAANPPLTQCARDDNCVPAQCCHPTTCVPAGSVTIDCHGMSCTEECRGGTMDCGGSCRCQHGVCIARFASNGLSELFQVSDASVPAAARLDAATTPNTRADAGRRRNR